MSALVGGAGDGMGAGGIGEAEHDHREDGVEGEHGVLAVGVLQIFACGIEDDRQRGEDGSEGGALGVRVEAGVDIGEAQDAETAAQGETQKKTVTRRLPLDMSKVELDLFAIDGIYINQLDGEF